MDPHDRPAIEQTLVFVAELGVVSCVGWGRRACVDDRLGVHIVGSSFDGEAAHVAGAGRDERVGGAALRQVVHFERGDLR